MWLALNFSGRADPASQREGFALTVCVDVHAHGWVVYERQRPTLVSFSLVLHSISRDRVSLDPVAHQLAVLAGQ